MEKYESIQYRDGGGGGGDALEKTRQIFVRDKFKIEHHTLHT